MTEPNPEAAAAEIKAWYFKINNEDAIVSELRTPKQNKSLHKYCAMVADEMNAAGYDFKTAITLPVTMTPELVKEYMFKRIMSVMYPDKESTTELDTVEIQKVYECMNAATGEKFGVSMDWPSLDSLSEAQR